MVNCSLEGPKEIYQPQYYDPLSVMAALWITQAGKYRVRVHLAATVLLYLHHPAKHPSVSHAILLIWRRNSLQKTKIRGIPKTNLAPPEAYPVCFKICPGEQGGRDVADDHQARFFQTKEGDLSYHLKSLGSPVEIFFRIVVKADTVAHLVEGCSSGIETAGIGVFLVGFYPA